MRVTGDELLRHGKKAGPGFLRPGVATLAVMLVTVLIAAPLAVAAGNNPIDGSQDAERFSERFGAADSHLMFHNAATRNGLMGAMSQSGIRWVRVVFAWSDIEPLEGRWLFQAADRALASAREHGVKVLGVLGFAPQWANGGNPPNWPPAVEHYPDWREYVTAVCGRYAADVSAWEIWNEQNIHAFWQPDPDAAEYVALVGETTPCVRAADPGATVVMGGVAGLGHDYLLSCLQAGVAQHIDAIAYHPYVETIGPPEGHAPKESLCRTLVALVRGLVRQHTTKPLEVWITEFGWTTYEREPGGQPPAVDESTQASYLLRSLINYASTDVDQVFWYCLWDEEDDPGNPEYNYGLLRNDLSPRPSFYSYRTFLQLFGGATAALREVASYGCSRPESLEAHAFRLESGDMAVGLWKSDDLNDTLSMTVSDARYECPVSVDPLTGKESVVPGATHAPGGKVRIENLKVGRKPVLLRFERTSPVWYLAEGSTDWGFDSYISIGNPNDVAVSAGITYMTGGGRVKGPDINLPARSQATLFPRETVHSQDFSTKVECREGLSIAADRTMYWDRQGAEAHCSVGVTSPATSWYFPEGSSKWGFETWLVIQNPGGTTASCTLTYMTEGESPRAFTKRVPPYSRSSFDMAQDIGARDASVMVTSDIPVIPERAMYRNDRRSGHNSTGATSPSLEYYLAEGCTDWGFTTYVLLQNPNSAHSLVTLTYMTPSGPVTQPQFAMPPGSRKTIRVNDVLPGKDFSTKASGTLPVVAERVMYWDNGTGEASHSSVGVQGPHFSWVLPDGDSTNGRETWTLVQNPNSVPVTVEIRYMTPDGLENVAFTDIVPADSRRTYDMAQRLPGSRAAVTVVSKTSGAAIIAERAIYWNSRGAGSGTVGGYSY